MKKFVADVVCCLAIIALALTIGLPRYCNGIDLGDEGSVAYGALRVLEGQVPSRDFDTDQMPLSFYTVAIMFKLFGTSLVSMRVLGLCIYVLIPVLVYGLSRQLVGRVMALAAAVPATVLGMPLSNFVPFASTHGIITTLAGALLIMQAMTTRRRCWAFLAGLTTALVMLSRQDHGFYLSVAFLVYALALKFAKTTSSNKPCLGRVLGFWTAGVAMLMLPFGVYWLLCGAIPDMFEQLVVFPLTSYSKTSSLPMPVFHSDWSLQSNILVALFYLTPIVGGLAAVWLLVRLVSRSFYIEQARIAFIVVLSILYYHQVMVRSDIYHLLDTLPPFFVLCSIVLTIASNAIGSAIGRAYSRDRNSQQVSFVVTTMVLLMAGAIGVWFLLYTKSFFLPPQQPSRTLLLDRGGVRINPQYASLIENVNRTVQMYAEPNQSILTLPYQPMFYFLFQRRNPTQWDLLWPGDQTPEHHQALIDQAKNDLPAVVLIFEREKLQRYAPSIIDYVDTEHKIARSFDELTLYIPVDKER